MSAGQEVTALGSSLIGRKVNNYEIKGLLGEGGMGAVFVAEHPLIGRKVAVKVLKRAFAEDPHLVQRFINEARAANAIHHANIIEILDAGTLEDGLPYLVMELLEGQSLGGRLRSAGRLGISEAIDIACQAASALTAAHDKGIVHRDLKPDNLFLVRGGERGGPARVKVLDFGIAKLHKDLSGDVHTSTGSILGTPPYMSPEQCKGVSGEIDHRSDVYSLGIILYEMLCGKPPFSSQGYGDILMMQMAMVPPPPRSLNPEISGRLEHTILRALEKRREDRFATMAAFQAELGAQRSPSGLSGPFLSEVDRLDPALTPTESLGAGVSEAAPASPTTLRSTTGEMAARPAAPTTRVSRRAIMIGAATAGIATILVLGVLANGRGARSGQPAPAAVPLAAPVTPLPAVAPPRAAPPASPADKPELDRAPAARPAQPKIPLRRKQTPVGKAPAPKLEKL